MLENPCKTSELSSELTFDQLYAVVGLGSRQQEFDDLTDSFSLKFDSDSSYNYGRVLCGRRAYILSLVTEDGNG